MLTCVVSDDFPACLQRIDPHDSLSESLESIYVQYCRILLGSASEFLLYDYTYYHFMYGTVLVLYSLVVNTIKRSVLLELWVSTTENIFSRRQSVMRAQRTEITPSI